MEAELLLARTKIEREEKEQQPHHGTAPVTTDPRELPKPNAHVLPVWGRQKRRPLRRPKQETITKYNLGLLKPNS